VLKLPLGVRLSDGSEEASKTENISKSGLCFACSLEMHVGERVYVRLGLDSPEERSDLPARIMWRRPAKDKGRAFYGVKLERRE
jgi:Tfp pilus assembly protein PilZ